MILLLGVKSRMFRFCTWGARVMPAMLKCKNCGKPFRSAVQADKESFETARLRTNEPCKNCGQKASYTKLDFHWQD
jgi:transcription elongation factor Elf1